ncbi:MAG: TetR/AcrR family transcriptional regulator [Ancalomicrobiaceae bacterium]|nr:TetR/AcrR family transcriptional regulator [Ancalomicrobiaceae bacterium]
MTEMAPKAMNRQPATKAGRKPSSKAAKAAAPHSRNAAPTQERLLSAAQAEFALHGYSGARIQRILSKAKANPRMLYHHFGSKSALYVAVLEAAFADLRRYELSLDVGDMQPLEGLLRLFDFMNDHFEANLALVSLIRNENLMKARFLKTSTKIREISSPVLAMVARFLERGAADRTLAANLDPLRVYILMAAICQFHLSNVHTLSALFDQDLSAPAWRAARKQDARQMMRAYLLAGRG